jgi:prevent-host-death family protein
VKWQLQEAKQRFSEVVRQALDKGPQVVTRHGRKTVVVLSAADYERLTADQGDFKAFLLSSPDLARLPITRDRRRTRKIRL